MGTKSKNTIKAMIATDILNIYNRSNQVKKSINDNLEDTLDYFHSLIAQIPQSACGPLITKTPKVLKKKAIQRIETIPEDDIVKTDDIMLNTIVIHDKTENKDIQNENESGIIGRTKRAASKKAASNIKKLQSMSLSTKLRKPSILNEDVNTNKRRGSRTKRKISSKNSSDEDTSEGHKKHSKIEERAFNETISKKTTNTNKQEPQNCSSIIEDTILQEKIEIPKFSMTTRNSRKRTFSQSENGKSKKSNIIDDTVIAPIGNDIEEPSMYEDAIEKPTPIMNSTMNFNSTYTMQKIMNATVVLEPLSVMKLNETVTINKNLTNSIRKSNREKTFEPKIEVKSSKGSKCTSHSSSISLQDRMQQLKEAMANKEFDELLTEDESSPEVKKHKANIKKPEIKKRQKRRVKSVSSSEDEILNTPAKPTLKEMNAVPGLHEIKGIYKSNALFSPYAKESVRKRVEAFEQAGMNTPKITVDIDVPTRVTRTKTRAKAAAQAEISENVNIAEKTIAHKLARKSLAKAKKISLAKQNKDTDEHKENKLHGTQKANKVPPIEKINYKQQQKTTPLGKTKTQLPMSVNRIPHTPSNQINVNHNKISSTTRSNIITSVESLIQAPKSVSKRNSVDDKRRKFNDEDPKKKREETLRLMTEEKRRKRQEKELKNKLAREAKEKLDMEKRQKAEKEREEKARLAQQMQEKQREEMEKKRLAQLQRAQEKEQKRKEEEEQRLQRLQEQEEAERILAEQRRREQEAERRKELEARAQQQAVAEAMKAKNHMLMHQMKYESKHHGPTTYVLDSEPNDDESDNESSPKHVIPYWAQSQVRKMQLAMQRYIPEKAVYKFFDTRKCTPDLTQLFQGIDRSRLKRTSSAIWKTPPRYSMMETE